MARLVLALYEDFSAAWTAVRALTEAGFPRQEISLMAGDTAGEYGQLLSSDEEVWTPTGPTPTGEGAGLGAGIGAALGGLGGLLIGLGALVIPGIGPVIAAGPLAAAFSGLVGAGVGAAAGTVAGGLIGALVEAGVPEEEARLYSQGVQRGGVLVAARVEDERAAEAREILDRFHPLDLRAE